MREFYKENKTYIDKVVFLLVFVLFFLVFFKYILAYIFPFAMGFVLSLLISPLVRFLQRRLKIARGISTIFLIIAFIILIVVIGVSLVNRIVVEANNLSVSLPQQLEELRDFLINLEDRFENFMAFIPDEFYVDFSELVNSLMATITGSLGDFAKDFSVGIVTKVPSMVLAVFLSMLSAFFFTRDRKLIWDSVIKSLPKWFESRAIMIKDGFLSAVSGYLKAQLIIMSVISAVCILGLSIMRYPYAMIMGLVICVLDAMPLIGASIIFWPWAIFSMVSGNYTYAAGLLLINIACFFARQILEPKVVGQQIGVHPLLVLIALYLGLRLFGFIGLFLGPILLVTVKLIMKHTPDGEALTEPALEGPITDEPEDKAEDE